MRNSAVLLLAAGALLQAGAQRAQAWDYEGHRVVNQIALSTLPTNFPAFVREPAAAERIAFLSGEPDRWRNVQDLPLRHCNGPDHYIDVEELAKYELNPEKLPVFRYEFEAELALFRKAHPDKFSEPEPGRNEDHTRELVGLLPWAMAENYARLKSDFASLKAFEEGGGTPEEIANAQADVVYVMGVMGHYFADASQPLHTTIHHHGWVGENPNHFSTNTRIHSWIDGGYFAKIGGANLPYLQGKARPARLVEIEGRAAKPEEMFQVGMRFILEQNKLVQPLYEMDKEHRLSGDGEEGLRGRAFLEEQLLKAGQLLGDVWYSAWQQAPPDTFLRRQLASRKPPAEAAAKP